jgi:hypothetical protein
MSVEMLFLDFLDKRVVARLCGAEDVAFDGTTDNLFSIRVLCARCEPQKQDDCNGPHHVH